jgi:hypothetical protein
MRGRHLPIRGRVTEDLISRAKEAIPNGTQYLAIAPLPVPASISLSRPADGDSHAELEEDLRDWVREGLAVEIAIGVMPEYGVADNDELVSRAKGGVDGPR